MPIHVLDQLATLIQSQGEGLLFRWRAEVRQLASAKHLDIPTLNDHIPLLLEELVKALRAHSEATIAENLCDRSPPAHGIQRVDDGFDIEEVVAEYNILRNCLHDLANQHELSLQGQPFHIINRVLDMAIGGAVQSFATHQAMEVQRRREEYLAFVAHDLRTPLSAISLAARVLEMLPEGGGAAERSQMFKTLRRNVQHLEELVRTIIEENSNLQTETGIKLQRRSFDLWPLVESLIHDLHPVAGTASTRLMNKVPIDLVVSADAGLLRRVFQNLIANAIHYTPRGEVIIGAWELDAEGGIGCWVGDNGEGVPPEVVEKIFDKGESDPENAEGMGLGLAIVKTFVEAHGGEVNVESKEGVGSTFRFTLPTLPHTSGRSRYSI
ncbi:MAG: HAMP domain-containing sensor histidine kinase [Planctomycetaceae bacterium]